MIPHPTLPPEFDPDLYRAIPGQEHLSALSPAEATLHHQTEGRDAGLIGTAVHHRAALCQLLTAGTDIGADVLEIIPGISPSLCPPDYRVRYLDVMDTAHLRAFAQACGLDPAQAPEVHYLWRGEPYRDLIATRFTALFSCHNIQRHPNLTHHLRDAADILAPGGLYLLIVPDKRYCYDHYLPLSTIADVLEAHMENRQRHAPRHMLEHDLHHTHNDSRGHWNGDHGNDPRLAGNTAERGARISAALAARAAQTGHADIHAGIHAWRFTPDSFRLIFDDLHAAGLSPFTVERVYPTIRGSLEFFAVLRHMP